MEKLLITPYEILELAFSPQDQLDSAVVTDSRIESAQLKFLAPALGPIYIGLTDGAHADFCREYIKPALAYYIKYDLLLHLSVRIGNEGISRIKHTDHLPADSAVIGLIRSESREKAELFLHRAIDFLDQHPQEFPEWEPLREKRRPVEIKGGIIL